MTFFPRIGDRTDYSGVNESVWEKREGNKHREFALKALNAATQTKRQEIEKANGSRFSELHRLSYFDPVRMHTVDPMHNLYLGTAKHVFLTWIDMGILTPAKLKEVDEKMGKIKVPSDIGRIPGERNSFFLNLIFDPHTLTPNKYVGAS